MSVKRYCILDAQNVVTNIIIIKTEDEQKAIDDGCVEDDGTAQIGGTWDGQNFHPAPWPPDSQLGEDVKSKKKKKK